MKLTTLIMLLLIMGCGGTEPSKPKPIQDNYVLIGYDITKDGITIMSFPFEANSAYVNGLKITERYYGAKDSNGKHSLTIIHTSSNITLDRDKCPVLDSYTFVKECMYVIAHNTNLN